MKSKLNARSAFLVVFLYLVLSILAALLAAIFFGGIAASETDRIIDGVIDSGMVGTIIVLIILLFISIYVFKDSRRDIFFERKPFSLSKLYYLFPLAWLGVTLVALFNVDYSAYSLGEILLVLLATLAIGANEEIVTRGIMLIGLRNSGVTEWKAWLVTVAIFALLHLVNVLGGASPTILLVTFAGDITKSCGLAKKKRWRILVGDETYKAVRSRKEDTPCATIPHCLKPFETVST